jgi:hypothetical protein
VLKRMNFWSVAASWPFFISLSSLNGAFARGIATIGELGVDCCFGPSLLLFQLPM